MLFRKLRDYGAQLSTGHAYYQEDEIRFVIDLGSGTGRPQPQTMGEGEVRSSVPKVVRTSATAPFLLVDGPEYVFGLPVGDSAKSAKRAQARRSAYVEMVSRCADETGNPRIRAVADYVRREPDVEVVSTLTGHANDGVLSASAAKQWIAFRVDGQYVHDESDAAEFWAREVLRHAIAGEGQCSVCGAIGPLAKKSLVKAKGINAGAVTSANEVAFESFGLKGWQTTPVCPDCIGAVTAAFNDLMDTGGASQSVAELENRGGSRRIGEAKFAYWTPGDPEFANRAVAAMYDPEPGDVAALLDSPHSGRAASIPITRSRTRRGGKQENGRDESFHSFTASANSGRVVFRDWIDVPIRKVSNSLSTWFERVRIVDRSGDPSTVGINRLMASTVRKPGDIRAADYLALKRTALFAAPFPRRLLDAAIRRTISERRVTHARAALIKAAVLYLGSGDHCAGRNGPTWWGHGLPHNDKENRDLDTQTKTNLAQLDPNHPSEAYHLGRLLAVLDSIQYAAQKNAAVIDRYIGGAMSSPVTVFPRLLEMARKAHLPKIGRSAKGLRGKLQAEIEQLIPAQWPRRLSLLERGLFISGMHHQEAHRRAEIAAAVAARNRG